MTEPLPAAYGWRIPDAAGDPWLAVRGADDWPLLELKSTSAQDGDDTRIVDVTFENGRASARLVSADAADLAHPVLSRLALALAGVRELSFLHSGALTAHGRAWALVGGSRAGKSTLLGALAEMEAEVVCDDILLMRAGRVLAGPRLIDLRPDAADALGLSGALSVRAGYRRRVTLPAIGAELPLAGLVHLRWGSDQAAELRPLAPGERLARLAGLSAVGAVLCDPSILVELATLPAFELRRPRSFGAVRSAAKVLLRALQ